MDDAKRRRLEAAITPTSATKRDVADDREDYPLKPCDFGRWLKFDSMSIGQACFVLMGHEPPSLQALHVQPSSLGKLLGPRIAGYTDLLKSLHLSIQNESVSAYPVQESMGITMHVPWVGLAKWAKSKGYDLPQELVALVNNAAPAQELSTTAPIEQVPPADLHSAKKVPLGAPLETACNVPVKRRARIGWQDVAMPYLAATYKAGKFKTCKEFYRALTAEAGEVCSPFTVRDRELFVTDINQSVALSTLANHFPAVKDAAKKL